EVMALGGVAQGVEDDSWLHAGDAPVGIDLDHAVEVLREVEHDRDVAALPSQAGSAAATEDRHVVLTADAHPFHDVIERAGDDDADRHLAVVRSARRVERAISVAKSDRTLDVLAQIALEAVGGR